MAAGGDEFPREPEPANAGPRHRVLVVDDEDLVRRVIATLLRRSGLEVIEARDGLDALDKVRELPPDLVGEGDVTQNEVRLVVSDGEVSELRGSSKVEGFASETGAGGRILCQSDGAATLSASGSATLVDGRAEMPVELTLDQTMGVPLTAEACDPDLAGSVTVPMTARVVVDQGTAVVQLLEGGQIIFSVTLTR